MVSCFEQYRNVFVSDTQSSASQSLLTFVHCLYFTRLFTQRNMTSLKEKSLTDKETAV